LLEVQFGMNRKCSFEGYRIVAWDHQKNSFKKITWFLVCLQKSPLIVSPARSGMICWRSLSDQGSLDPMVET